MAVCISMNAGALIVRYFSEVRSLEPLRRLAVNNTLFRRLRLDQHQRLQHIPHSTKRLLLVLKFIPRLPVFRSVLLGVGHRSVFRQPPRDFPRERVRLFPPVFFSQLQLKTDGYGMSFEHRDLSLEAFAEIFPDRAISVGN